MNRLNFGLSLYLVCSGFLNLYAQNQSFITFNQSDGIASDRINHLLIGPDGLLWIGTDGTGISHFDGVTFTTALEAGHFIDDMWIDSLGNITIKSERGFFKYDGYVWSEKIDHSRKLDRKRIKDLEVNLLPALKKYKITAMAENLGQIWMTTENNGLIVFQPLDSTVLELANIQTPEHASSLSLMPRHLTDLVFDTQNNLWVGTATSGLLKYLGNGNPPYQLIDEEYPGRNILKLMVDVSDRLVSLDENGMLYLDNGGAQELIEVETLEVKDKIIDFSITPANGIIAISQNGGFFYAEEIPLKLKLSQQITAGGLVKRLEYVGAKSFIITDSELFEVNYNFLPGQMTPSFSTRLVSLPFSDIEDIHRDRQNRLWILSGGELGFLKNGHYQKVSSASQIRNLTCWYEDEKGTLWLGSRNAGIYYLNLYENEPMLKWLEKPFTNAWPEANNILVHESKIYLTSQSSIFELGANMAPSKIISWRQIGRNDGLPIVKFSPGALIINRANEIFAGTNKGILNFSGGPVNAAQQLPSIRLNNIAINSTPIVDTEYKGNFGTWYKQMGLVRLKHTDNNITITYAPTQLTSVTKLLYQWRLSASENWFPLTELRTIPLPNLQPGKYNFEVRACLTEDNCGASTSFAFEIRAPFYLTKWFYLSAFGLMSLIFGIWSWSRRRRLMKSHAAIQDRLKLEARSLELERKALQLQMNPHFIFNAINSIQGEIKEASVTQAKSHLAKFSRLMRRVLESSRVQYVTLEDELELLKDYITIAALSRGVEVEMLVDVDDKIDADVLEIPSMMLQPFVENAVHHGFKGKKEGKIKLSFILKGRNLIIEIADNGVGLMQRDDTSHISISTQVIRDRLKLLSRPGDLVIKENANANESGTTVLITLPLEKEA